MTNNSDLGTDDDNNEEVPAEAPEELAHETLSESDQEGEKEVRKREANMKPNTKKSPLLKYIRVLHLLISKYLMKTMRKLLWALKQQHLLKKSCKWVLQQEIQEKEPYHGRSIQLQPLRMFSGQQCWETVVPMVLSQCRLRIMHVCIF